MRPPALTCRLLPGLTMPAALCEPRERSAALTRPPLVSTGTTGWAPGGARLINAPPTTLVVASAVAPGVPGMPALTKSVQYVLLGGGVPGGTVCTAT